MISDTQMNFKVYASNGIFINGKMGEDGVWFKVDCVGVLRAALVSRAIG